MRRRVAIGVLVGIVLSAQAAGAATYTIDPDHTTVEFKIHHLLSYVRGTFNQFEGTFEYAPEHPEQWKANATIQAASIDTRVDKRDAHLRSPDFFAVEQYPTITFRSTAAADAVPTGAKLHGLLTIHGVEQPVVLDLTIHGLVADPWGNQRAAFTATTAINRKDFGLAWNKAVETGQLLVGETVEIILEVEGIAR